MAKTTKKFDVLSIAFDSFQMLCKYWYKIQYLFDTMTLIMIESYNNDFPFNSFAIHFTFDAKSVKFVSIQPFNWINKNLNFISTSTDWYSQHNVNRWRLLFIIIINNYFIMLLLWWIWLMFYFLFICRRLHDEYVDKCKCRHWKIIVGHPFTF